MKILIRRIFFFEATTLMERAAAIVWRFSPSPCNLQPLINLSINNTPPHRLDTSEIRTNTNKL